MALLGSLHARAQQDPFVGTWKLDLAKSRYDPPSLAPKGGPARAVRIEIFGEGYKLITDGVNAQGAATLTEHTVPTLDGNDYPVMSSPSHDAEAWKKIDANTCIEVDKKSGAVVSMTRLVVSRDGKTLEGDGIGYTARGVAFHNVAVFDRQ